MSISGNLLQMAKEAVARSEQRADKLRVEYLEAEKRLAALKAKLDFENLAEDRFANYQIVLGPDYQCPSCWIDSERKASLRPALSDTGESLLRYNYGHDQLLVVTYNRPAAWNGFKGDCQTWLNSNL